MAPRGGIKSFASLAGAVGDHSAVDGSEPGNVAVPLAGRSRTAPLSDLVGNPHNPRGSLRDLSDLESITSYQLQPVIVVSRGAYQKLYPDTAIGARWVVVIGNRRLAAAEKYGRSTLDIVVKDELAIDRGTLKGAIIAENVDRKGFDVIEEARAVADLVDELGRADQAAEQLKKSKTWVSQRLALLKLAPELQEALRGGDLAIRDARELAQVPLEQQVNRWSASRKRPAEPTNDDAGGDSAGEGSGNTETAEAPVAPMRALTRAVRNFDSEPHALAVALHEQIGEAGTKTLMSQLRKLLR